MKPKLSSLTIGVFSLLVINNSFSKDELPPLDYGKYTFRGTITNQSRRQISGFRDTLSATSYRNGGTQIVVPYGDLTATFRFTRNGRYYFLLSDPNTPSSRTRSIGRWFQKKNRVIHTRSRSSTSRTVSGDFGWFADRIIFTVRPEPNRILKASGRKLK